MTFYAEKPKLCHFDWKIHVYAKINGGIFFI